MTQTSNTSMPLPQDEDADHKKKPAMSADSQAFIGLKLREFYDDVVAEPVPDRFLELLGKLGEDDSADKTE